MTFAPGSKATAVLRAFLCLSVVLLVAANVHAQSERQVRPNGPGTGIPDDDLVPWKFVEKGAAIEKASLTLYWLPASQKEMEHSELLRSRASSSPACDASPFESFSRRMWQPPSCSAQPELFPQRCS